MQPSPMQPTLSLAFVVATSCLALPAQTLVRRFDQLSPSGGPTGAFAQAGDVDGDGVEDLVCALGTYPRDLAVLSGASGAVLWRVPGSVSGVFDIDDLDGGSDVDGDGVADVVFGSSTDLAVQVRSGVDGGLLLHIASFCSIRELRFGHEVAFVGDVDADGYQDIGVSALFIDGGFAAGSGGGVGCAHDHGEAYVYSGRDGALLHRLVEPVYRGTLGWGLGPAGDADADGYDDVRIDALDQVRVVSGRDGTLLFSVPRGHGNGAGLFFHMRAAAPAGDQDRDGHDDLFVQHSGVVLRYSGVDGSVISWPGEAAHVGRGDLAAAGDVDGDGFEDFVVGVPNVDGGAGPDSGTVMLCSGATGAVLLVLPGLVAHQGLGASVASAGDLDGDGRAEILVGAMGWRSSPDPSQLGVFAYTLDGPGVASSARRFGAPCPGADGNLPRIGADSRAFVGESFALTLRGAPTSAPAALLLGAEHPVALDPFGASGCWLHMRSDTAVVLAATDALGMANTGPLPVPAAARASAQWGVLAARANALGLVTSDVLRLVARPRL